MSDFLSSYVFIPLAYTVNAYTVNTYTVIGNSIQSYDYVHLYAIGLLGQEGKL